ncbi:hypothetical protein BKA69DRAFT_329616 [Paraphysoderma sedebokerense]|nr:hypothetical protein BKA69DRAFT_329616 [Paraphysoderma sedebokerense]
MLKICLQSSQIIFKSSIYSLSPVPVIPRLQTANQVPDNGSAEAPIRDEFTEASQEEIKLVLVETVLVMSKQTFLPPNDVSRLSKSELHDRNQGLRNRFIGSLTLAILDCVIIVSNQREKTESDKNLKRKAESVRCGLEIVVNVLDIWKRGIGEATSDLNQNRGGIDDLQLGLKSSIDNTLFELSRLPYLFQLFVHESTRSEEMLARSEKDGVVWTNPAELQSSFEQILKRMIMIYRNLSGKNDDARLYESCVCLRDCLARFRYWRVVVEEWVLLFGTE